MSQILEIPITSGTQTHQDLVAEPPSPPLRVLVKDDIELLLHRHGTPADLKTALGGVLPGLKAIGEQAQHDLTPSKVTLTAGIKVSAGPVAVIAGGEAGFTLSVEWDHSAAPSATVSAPPPPSAQ